MQTIAKARAELLEMDALASKTSFYHALHPLVKLLTTCLYILTVVSFPKYDLPGLMGMVLYPAVLFQLADLSPGLCFYRLRVVLPLVCAVGLVNPFLDRRVLLSLGTVPITGGMVSMVTLMLKGVFSLMASFLLVAATSMDALCAALRKLHVPAVLVCLLLLTYRYIGVLMEEAAVMMESYTLRAPSQKGLHISAWGSFLGQLLLRSMDRARELYSSMVLRGFHGDFFYADAPKFSRRDCLFCFGTAAFFLLAKTVSLPALLGRLIVR